MNAQTPAISEGGSLVLVVEDDPQVLSLVRMNLEHDGHRVVECCEGVEAVDMVREHEPDLILLDVMLPGRSGLDVCRELRAERGQRDAILMLTALAEEVDVVVGLEVGADDYLTKPFGARELRARVRALLRRSQAAMRTDDEPISLGNGVRLIVSERVVRHPDGELTMTGREFDLLVHLARHPGRVFSRDDLLNAVWGDDFIGIDRTVDSHVTRVRKKLRPFTGEREVIETVHGIGYRFRRLGGD